MMYIHDLAAIADLTLAVAGSLPVAVRLTEKTLPGALYQTDHAIGPVGQERGGRMLTDNAPSHTGALHEESCDPTS